MASSLAVAPRDLGRATLGRNLLVAHVNRATDGALRDTQLLGELPLGLKAGSQRLPGEELRVRSQDDLDLPVGERPRPANRALPGSAGGSAQPNDG